jgi:ABC-type lipoprotein release transport system permease subunit
MVAGTDMRRHWRGTVVVMLLVGLVGAIVLASVAGARRSDSALARFIDYSHSANLQLMVGRATPAQLDEFRRTPGAGTVAVLEGAAVQPTTPSPALANLATAMQLDTILGTRVDRPRVVKGRRANPNAANEINIGESLAAQLHIGVGGHLDLGSYTPQQIAAFQSGSSNVSNRPQGPPVHLDVVGIVRRPLDLGVLGGAGGVVLMSPAFAREHASDIGTFGGDILRVRTRTPSDLPAVTAAARRIFGKAPDFSVQSLAIESEGARNAIDVLTVALYVFAAVAGIAGLVAIAIVLNREVSISAADEPTLQALGTSRRQRVAINATRPLVIAGVGALLAVGVAIAASPLLPFGVARKADPDPGLHADWIVLGIGLAAVFLVVVLLAWIAARRSDRLASRAHRAGRARVGTRVADAANAAGLAPPAAAGLRMAVEPGSGDTAVPLRSAFVGVVFGVVGVVAVIVFASGLHHVATTPRLYGWTWSTAAETQQGSCDRNDAGLSRQPGVSAVAAICYIDIDIDGRPVVGWGLTPIAGSIGPEIVRGAAPRTPDEVALGVKTLDALHKKIGDTVEAHGPTGSVTYRIVGTTVFPRLADPQPLADGAWFTQPGLAPVQQSSENFTRFVVARLAPGADRAAIDAKLGQQRNIGVVEDSIRPVEISRLQQINWFPAVLAGLLALLALIAVAHALVTGTRRRRRDLALLKTLGFDRSQLRTTIACQATAIAVVGLVVGIPLGLLIGNTVWRVVANGLGVADVVAAPVLVLLIIPVVVLLVNAVAYFPGRAAARTRPAVALRAE